jgi:hypothetical protein
MRCRIVTGPGSLYGVIHRAIYGYIVGFSIQHISGILAGMPGIHHAQNLISMGKAYQPMGGFSIGGIEHPLTVNDGISFK